MMGDRTYCDRLVALSLLTCFLSVTSAQADEVTRAWLDRMGHAIQTLSYHGQFIHSDDRRSQSMGVVHRVDDGGLVNERLWSLDGPSREFIRKNNEIKCILSDNQEVVVEQVTSDTSFGFQVPEFSPSLDSLYSLVTHGEEERIAGRDTQKIDILPVDRYRYGYRLWLDVETAMPLRSDLVGSNNETLEKTYFISIDFRDDIDDSELDQELSADGYLHHVSHPDAIAQNQSNLMVKWAAHKLPRGFYLTGASVEPAPDGHGDMVHLVYSDGLATVSVFIEPLLDENQDIFRGVSPDMNAYGISARGGDSDSIYQVTVMGEVPKLTLRTIAESVRYKTR